MRGKVVLAWVVSSVVGWAAGPVVAQTKEVIPHAQDRPPGPALSPAEAIRKMTVPEGFAVELVASEPDIVNPVAMTFDERGRIWITESLEYPRQAPGPGRDRVKVLEDTDGDGRADQFAIFAEGLNIPSGVAVGGGGVWVANSPDILFYPNADGDLTPDGPPQVVVTGFGRADTHELPNTLAWGPDGWLYGWNGVFNPSHVEYRGTVYDFTCAVFRIHPKTRDFELFCEGTSNPWGLTWDREGSAFASACVIDHLWHLVETGYYHRQGGPYPPFTWKIDSIVDHRHQKAAYCGIHFYDSDAYPPEYRGRLFMGNIHGNSINSDVLRRDGASYRADAAPDFLAANDAWFMPVVQKTGPDGCLYILDWYDRYHCYQDANRDPQGIDRLKGRLYRVRYQDTPRRANFDLARESDDALIRRLDSPNGFDRDIARRLLVERGTSPIREELETIVRDNAAARRTRMLALWSLVGIGPLRPEFHAALLDHADAGFRAWAVRAAGDASAVEPAIRDKVVALAADPSPDVRLQVAIAARKIAGLDPIPVLVEVLAHGGPDRLIPRIVWQNLHPLLEDRADEFLAQAERPDRREAVAPLMPRVVERILGRRDPDPAPVVELFTLLAEGTAADRKAARQCLAILAGRVQTGELAGARLVALRARIQPLLGRILAGPPDAVLALDAALLAVSWKDPAALGAVRSILDRPKAPEALRLRALDALIAAADPAALALSARILADPRSGSAEFRGKLLGALGRLDDPKVAEAVLASYPTLPPDQKPRAIELLCQRPAWSRLLLGAIGRKAIPADALNVNQVRQLQSSPDSELARLVRSQWGIVREGRNPAREQVVAQMRGVIRQRPGDPAAGRLAFQKLCAQCHKIFGEGQEVGPDLTGVGRDSFELLLSNVFDPSLVIGAAYQATTVATADGRVLTGILAEDSPQRVVLKTQGGKLEIIAHGDVDEMKVSELSLMPENIETQLTPSEWSDLFSFLLQDQPAAGK
ncbi:MAG TPA: PVC-type heme-binding CxxCH protein [Isosphaeraceae bacterium]|jgi:putative membrane-bound dehydrogenase-like protein